MKIIPFNPNGERLWVSMETRGLYFISYIYQLWSANANEPPILTNPMKQGNNIIPHDDFYLIQNDFNPAEPLSKFRNRIIDVRYWVKKLQSDDGYGLRVSVWQGNDFNTANLLGSEEIPTEGSSTLGDLGLKEEFITIQITF
jgi:hypothetical protein